MSSALQNRKVLIKFVNFQDDPCMIFRRSNQFTIHLTSRQTTVKDVIDLVNFKFPALANKELIFRPNEGGRVLRANDPATLVWSQLVVEKRKGGIPTGSLKRKASSLGAGGSTPSSESCGKRMTPKKSDIATETFRRLVPAMKSSTQSKATHSASTSNNSSKKLTCRKTSAIRHKRFDIELEEEDETRRSSFDTSSKSKKQKISSSSPVQAKTSMSVFEKRQGRDCEEGSPARGPESSIGPGQSPSLKYQKYQGKYQRKYQELTDLTCVPKIRDVVAFKLMHLEPRMNERQKVMKLSAFKEGVVTTVDPRNRMVQVELSEPFDIPDDSIAGPGRCKLITVDWSSVYFPKLVSREES